MHRHCRASPEGLDYTLAARLKDSAWRRLAAAQGISWPSRRFPPILDSPHPTSSHHALLKLETIIKPLALDEVIDELLKVGVHSLSYSDLTSD